MIPFMVCGLDIQTDKSLEEVALLISKEILGGIPFIGREEFIRDEIPAVYVKDAILGFDVVLQGGDGHFFLELTSIRSEDAFNEIDISDYIALLIKQVDGLSCKSSGLIK
jgi:hypothetical protein